MQPRDIGILEQLGGGALPCPGRRHALRRIGKELVQVAHLAPGVEHAEPGEEPVLQFGRAAVTFVFQPHDLLGECPNTGARSSKAFVPPLPETPQFGLFVLALADECGKKRLVRALRTLPVPLRLGAEGCRAGLVQRACGLPCEALQLRAGLAQLRVALQTGDTPVERRDGRLLLPEEVARTEHVVDRRNEVGMAVAPRKIAREGGKKPYPTLRMAHDQHAEHLAGGKFVAPCAARREVLLHARCGGDAERMGRIAEGTGEACGQRRRVDRLRETMQRPAGIIARAMRSLRRSASGGSRNGLVGACAATERSGWLRTPTGRRCCGSSGRGGFEFLPAHDVTPPLRSRVCNSGRVRPRPAR